MLKASLLVASALTICSAASAQCATATATNNAGSLTLDHDGTAAMSFCIFILGDTQGTTTVNIGPLATVDLGLASPFVPLAAGFTDMNGDASVTFQVPSVVPAGTYYAQGVTAGFSITPGSGISFDVCASTVASFTL